MIHSENQDIFSNKYRFLLLAAAATSFILIVLDGIMRVGGARFVCPDWPTCNGASLPSLSMRATIDYAYMLAAIVGAVLILVMAFAKVRHFREHKLIRVPLVAALLLIGVQTLLAILALWFERPGWTEALHLGNGLMTFGLILTATVIVFFSKHVPLQVRRLRFRSPFARLSLWSLGATFLVLVTGALVASGDSTLACTGWPLCNSPITIGNFAGWMHVSHRVIVGGTSLIMLVLLWQAWRTQQSKRAILSSATVAVVLFHGQILIGALMSMPGYPIYLLGLHQFTAVSVWGALVILVICIGFAARSAQDEDFEAYQPFTQRQRLRDLLSLTKPIIVALLLVTTFTGMVVGGKELPAFSLVAWTLLAGALAAGGSGAVNQYIDRELDQRMARTAGRPIASGRMTPAEGLAFGLALLLISFYLFAVFVNLLAALLSLAGMLYYVLLYSIYLKKATVQNIVIGGGAGAIPPLVGWAAATGSINIPALFLFAIIFLWTPPHFWALALVRSKDYERAGIPMLPAVRGKKETRKQILLYSLQLVALTLLMPLFGMAGSVFLIAALILGMWILHAAYRVWHIGGNKVAWKLYRYSSMYLAFLFVALIVDALM